MRTYLPLFQQPSLRYKPINLLMDGAGSFNSPTKQGTPWIISQDGSFNSASKQGVPWIVSQRTKSKQRHLPLVSKMPRSITRIHLPSNASPHCSPAPLPDMMADTPLSSLWNVLPRLQLLAPLFSSIEHLTRLPSMQRRRPANDASPAGPLACLPHPLLYVKATHTMLAPSQSTFKETSQSPDAPFFVFVFCFDLVMHLLTWKLEVRTGQEHN